MATSPSFPKGLRVLLVAGDDKAALKTTLECPELSYAVTCASSTAEALCYTRTGVAAFDVVLAESRMVTCDEAMGRSFIDSFEDTPVVLMSAGGTTDDVMRSVKLGAVDFLDKPLSLLKLKNIWQHSVRKMMMKAAGPRRPSLAGHASVSVSVAPATAASPAQLVVPSFGTNQLPPSPWTTLSAVKPASLASTAGGATASGCTLPTSPSTLSMSLAGPECPGTPSAVSGGDMPETYSICSSGTDSGAASLRASMDCGPSESFVEAMNSAINGGSGGSDGAQLPRPTSFTSLPTPPQPAAAPAAAPAPAAPHHWPALTPGCVWGTPVNGPVPPPLPASASAAPHNAWGQLQPASAAPVLIKCSAPAAPAPLLPAPVPAASPEDVAPADDFLLEDLLAPRPGGCSGPLGLKLRKSPSLLNMINSALTTDAPACPGSMGLAPMLF